MHRPIVWVVNWSGHPYHKVHQLLGEDIQIKALTSADINPLYVDRLNYKLAEGIARYANKDDFLLFSGKPPINAFALTLWILQFKVCKSLQWNAVSRSYQLAVVEEADLRKLLDNMLLTQS